MRERRTGFWSAPYLAVIIATLVAAVLVAVLIPATFEPIEPGCREWCNLGRSLALTGISLVAFAWLAFLWLLAWLWRKGEPPIAGVIALLTAAALAVAISLTPTSRLPQYALFNLVAVVALGLQLPPAWHMAQQSRPRFAGRAGAGIMTIATLVGVAAFVATGQSVFSEGPRFLLLAGITSMLGLALLTGVAWRGGGVGTIGSLLLGAASLWTLSTSTYSALDGADLGGIAFASLVLLALAWGWVGIGWLRHG